MKSRRPSQSPLQSRPESVRPPLRQDLRGNSFRMERMKQRQASAEQEGPTGAEQGPTEGAAPEAERATQGEEVAKDGGAAEGREETAAEASTEEEREVEEVGEEDQSEEEAPAPAVEEAGVEAEPPPDSEAPPADNSLPDAAPAGGDGGSPAPSGGGSGGGGGSEGGGGEEIQVEEGTGGGGSGFSAGRPPDGLTDYYMETHWDATEFHTIAKDVGYPGDLSTERVSTVDRLLPADTSPDIRALVNVAAAAASGFFDDFMIEQASSYLGISGDFLQGLLDAGEGISTYSELDDPTGRALFGGMTVLDAVAGGLDAALDRASQIVSVLSSVSIGISGAILVLGQIPVAVATAVANAVGFATAEALVAELSALSASISAILEAVKVPIQAARALVDVFQSALDVILYMYNDYAAGQAEQSERFDRAAQYRDLMRGNAFDAMTDWLQGAVNGLLMIPYASTVRTVGIVAINLATSGPSMDLTTWKGPTIDGTVGTLENLADAVSDTTVANDLLSEMGAATPGISPVNIGDLADPMRVDPEGMGRHYVERRPLAGAGALSDARSRTVDWLTQSYNNLRGDDPSWYQALVNDIANPANGPAYKEATSPSYWLGELLRNMPALGEFLADHSLEGIATGCEAAASVLPAAQPVFDSIALMVLEMKPQLQEVLGEVNAYVQQHAVDLSALEDFANEVEQGLEGLRSMLDPADALDSVADSIVGTLEGLRVDPARFGLPSWLPVDIESVVAPVNDAVDGAIAQVRAMQEELVEAWRERVESILLAVEAQVAAFRAQVSEGGAFHNSLVQQVEEFKGLLAQAEEAFAEWDGVVELDARAGADWLRAVAAAARTAAEEEQFLQEEGADPWPAILRDTAQPAIDAWRGRHQADVESQYSPPVPQWEVDACVQLAGEVLDDPSISEEHRSSVEGALQSCTGLAGQEGREALYHLWRAEDALMHAVAEARRG